MLGLTYYNRSRKMQIEKDEKAIDWIPPTRNKILDKLKTFDRNRVLDVLVIGGGATGAGCALEAASRGFIVACVEKGDFASATSSRSTKLVHGGVRYLEKAVLDLDWQQYKLVREALRERQSMLKTMPHLTHPLALMLPVYGKPWLVPYYWFGSKAYDFIAGSMGLMPASQYLSVKESLARFPGLKAQGLQGSILYYDGQMNDSRCNLTIALTALYRGALVMNYVEAESLIKDDNGVLIGATLHDRESGERFEVHARKIINATGPYCDKLRRQDNPDAVPLVVPSSGAHVVLPGILTSTQTGLIDPHTDDGRVLFVLPWQGVTIAGTTDEPCQITENPRPSQYELDWIMNATGRLLERPPTQIQVQASWAGIRPLIKDPRKLLTGDLVRSHLIEVSPKSGLITVAGGKWTTWRSMVEETLDVAYPGSRHVLPQMMIGAHEYQGDQDVLKLTRLFNIEADVAKHLSRAYGDRAFEVAAMSTGSEHDRLHPRLPFIDAEVRYAVRRELALHPEDILTRRFGISFTHARESEELVDRVTRIMAEELSWGKSKSKEESQRCRAYLKDQFLQFPNTKPPFNIQDLRSRFEALSAGSWRIPVDQGIKLIGRDCFKDKASVSLADLLDCLQ